MVGRRLEKRTARFSPALSRRRIKNVAPMISGIDRASPPQRMNSAIWATFGGSCAYALPETESVKAMEPKTQGRFLEARMFMDSPTDVDAPARRRPSAAKPKQLERSRPPLTDSRAERRRSP